MKEKLERYVVWLKVKNHKGHDDPEYTEIFAEEFDHYPTDAELFEVWDSELFKVHDQLINIKVEKQMRFY